MEKFLQYPNGLRAVVEYSPAVKSVAAGIWVGVGSRYEDNFRNGLAHFTEHMMFKGTDKLSPEEIANAFENYGAGINAFTGKEYTCYYFRSIDEYSENCFSLLSDIFFDSTFDADELDKERKVIAEEINMVEDSPEDMCFDELSYALYGDSGLGRTILGPAENVARFSGDDVRAFMSEFYIPEKTVISFSGNITLSQADALIKKYVLHRFKSSGIKKAPQIVTRSGRVYREKIDDFEQANIALSFNGVKFMDSLMSTQAVLNVIVGGGMSSRLFQSVRERQGLAYSVYSAPSGYSDTGTFNILLNITHTNTEKAILSVRHELEKLLKESISADELQRAKIQLKSAVIFSEESVQSQMSSLGKTMLVADTVYDVNDKINDINAVTVDMVWEYAKKCFDFNSLCAAYVGKKQDADILKLFE